MRTSNKLLLGALNVLGFESLAAFDQLKADGLAFVEGFEAPASDRGVVDEDVLTGILGDEAEALFVVEPFDFAAGHTVLLLIGTS